jgi:hypothetical protein
MMNHHLFLIDILLLRFLLFCIHFDIYLKSIYVCVYIYSDKINRLFININMFLENNTSDQTKQKKVLFIFYFSLVLCGNMVLINVFN